MSRNGAGVYSLPPVYEAVSGETILATQHNTPLEDLEADANSARPIVAGGTGTTTAVGALDNLHTKGSNVASASTTNLSTATGDLVHITGTTTITAFTSQTAGNERTVVFDASLTLTHNATSLILPDGTNIITKAGDSAVFRSEGSGNWKCVSYTHNDRSATASSATTTNIGATGKPFVHITGTTTITAFDTANKGVLKEVVFDGALTLTHNGTSLILQGAANVTTAAGDSAIFVSEGSGNWRCIGYQSATSNVPVVTSWTAYTPTFTGFGTVSGVDAYWRRVGDTLELDIKFVSGTSQPTEARMSLPSGLTSASGYNIRAAGYAVSQVSGSALWVALSENSVSYLTFGLQGASTGGLTKINGSGMVSSGNALSFRASVRIAGW